MNPRAWALWSAAALVVVLTGTNPAYRALVLLVCLNVVMALRRSDVNLRALSIAVGVTALVATLLNAVLSHTGAHVLLTVPDQVPALGGRITLEAVLYGADVAVGIVAAVLAVAPLSIVLHPHELLDAFPRPLQRTAALTGAAINLVPGLARNAVAISEAQRMRGVHSRIRDWRNVASPLVLSALDDSLQLAEAMEARGFGARARTRYAAAAMDGRALLVIACSLAAIVLTVVARATGGLADWYPFPVATMPDIALMPVAACALLASPLVAWHRS
jgi:energy-coupling factor transport system permease protein